MVRPLLLTLMLLVLLLPLSASAQMTLLSQSRAIDSTAEIVDDNTGDFYGWSDSITAPDFQIFEENIFTDASDFFGYCDSEASQESTLGPASFYLNGYAYTDAELFENGYTAYVSANSFFAVEFSISESTDWSLLGTIEGQAAATANISLVDEFDFPVFSESWTNNSLPLLIDSGGTIPAGIYTLVVEANSSEDMFEPGFYVASQASFDLQFDVTGGPSPVIDELTQSRYLKAGPNPMQNETTIAFSGTKGQSVELVVYDIRGRLVRRLLNAGSSQGQVAWDGRNNSGQDVPQGVYFVRMNDGQEYLQRKVSIIR